jgi:hypothetical protein
MYPLLAFFVISITVILERAMFYILSRARSLRTIEELAAFGKECGDWKEAAKYFAEKHLCVYFLPLVAACFGPLDEDQRLFEEHLFAQAKEIVMVNERRFSILVSVASIAPLLGLFGTVLGIIIQVFQRLAALGGRAGGCGASFGRNLGCPHYHGLRPLCRHSLPAGPSLFFTHSEREERLHGTFNFPLKHTYRKSRRGRTSMNSFSRKTTQSAEVNITPLLDIVFQLSLFQNPQMNNWRYFRATRHSATAINTNDTFL